MRICFLIYLFPLYLACCQVQAKPTICLNMIVKDESPVIRRCLASVKPWIDYWVIVDTGSTDGTQDIITEYMQDIPGELHESPWVDFAHNRNEALILAKDKGDYLLFIDADEILIPSEDFSLPELNLDFYYVMTNFAGTKYARVQLINNHLNWQWYGVVHETIDCPEARQAATLAGIVNSVTTEGHRSQDPQKYQKDVSILERAVEQEPDNTRYVFYLAQSYRDAKQLDQALNTYQKRVSMGGWDQEIFWSLLQIGRIQEALHISEDIFMQSYYEAYLFRPSRMEPLYYLTFYYRKTEQYEKGYLMGRQALSIHKSGDILFVEEWIYNYGLLLEFSLCAYYTEHYVEALLASQLILSCSSTPPHVRECVQNNLLWIQPKSQLAQTP